MNTTPTIKRLSLSVIEEADYNPRSIGAPALQGLRQSLVAYGVLELPVVNMHGGRTRLISGHQRVLALKREGVLEVDCVMVDFDDAKEMAANLTMNNPALQGTYDPLRVLPTLKVIEADLVSSDLMGFEPTAASLRKQAERLDVGRRHVAIDELDETPLLADSEEGVLYALGDHLLYCGKPSDGLLAFQGSKGFQRAAACVSGTPRLSGEVWPDWKESTEDFMRLCLESTDGPCYLVLGRADWLHLYADSWKSCGGSLRRWLVWGYPSPGFRGGNYKEQHSFVLYGCRDGADLKAPESRRGNVLLRERVTSSMPSALAHDFLEDSTQPKDVVLDLGAEKGTVLSVAEEMGRTCYSVEENPVLCDKIRQRWVAQKFSDTASWAEMAPPVNTST
jgi:hypothetical protein